MSGEELKNVRAEFKAELADIRGQIRQLSQELSSVRSDLIRVALAVGGGSSEEPPQSSGI